MYTPPSIPATTAVRRLKSSSDVAKPQAAEPRVKMTMAARNTVRAPKRSAAQPLTGMNTASDKR